MKIPVIINNRDLLTWPKAMLERISRYTDVGTIIIVDNGSTNPELMSWYKTRPCDFVIYAPNLGHTAPWQIFPEFCKGKYVVTDSDLDLSNTPDDTLVYLLDKLQSLKLDKLGLGLDFSKVPENSPYYTHMNNYERPRWLSSRFEQEIALDVAIDTTFALYSVPHY